LTKKEIGERLNEVLEFQKSISNIVNGIKISPKKKSDAAHYEVASDLTQQR
jgi:hypothetical protein